MTTQRTFDTEAEMTATALVERDNANPFTLLQQAIDANVDPDRLERIMAMYERWEDRQAEKAFAEAMTACQKAMKPVERNAFNKQTGSYYPDLFSIHAQLKPIWLDHGFTLSSGSEQSPIPNHYRAVCDVRHVEGHTVRYYLDGPADDKGLKGSPNKTPIQGVVSTMTYLERKLTCMIFCVTIYGEDNDGQRDVTPITDEQLNELDDMMRQIVERFGEAERGRFYKYMEVTKLSEIPASRFNDAKSAMRSKLKNANR